MTKKIFFSVVLSLAAVLTYGQLVLTGENFIWDTQHLTGNYNIRQATGISLPDEGENMVWDYSNLLINDSASRTYIESLIPALPLSEYYYLFTNYLGSGISYTKERHLFINSEGWRVEGLITHYTYNDISAFTGSPGDNVTFPADTFLYTTPGYILTFPTEYNHNTTDTMLTLTLFNLTQAAFGYSNAPCLQKQYMITNDLISGNGTMKIPSTNIPNNPVEAIQVKRHIILIDSFFVQGQPADPALLAAFGLTQGQTFHSYDYYFYREYTHNYLFRIACNPGFISAYAALWDAELPIISAVGKVEKNDFSIYPNPVSDQLMFSKITNYEILDLNGKPILVGEHANSCDVSILKTGIYIFKSPENNFLSKFLMK